MSYLLTFALLHSNAAWAGNGRVFGMLDLEEDDAHSSPIAIPRQSQDEKTPLKTTGRKPIPNPLIQFQSLKDLSTVGSQAGNIQGNSLGFPLEDESMDSSGSNPIPDLSTKANDDDTIPDVTGINFQEIAAKGSLPQSQQAPSDKGNSANPSFIPPADNEKDSSEDSPRRPSSESSPPLTSSSPEGEHRHDSGIPLQRTTLDLSSSGEGSGGNAPSLAIQNPGDEDSDSGDPDMDFSKLKVTDKDKNEKANEEQPLLEPKEQAVVKDQDVQKTARIEVSGTGPADHSLQLKQPINSDHALIPLGDGDDPEDGWGKFTITINDDTALHAFLLHAHYLIEGKPTWWQIFFGGLGLPIGIGVGNAMPPIFMGDLDDLWPSFSDEMANDDIAANLLIFQIASSLGIDAISRNVRILGELAAPSKERFSVPKSQKIKNLRYTLLACTYGGAAIAALLPVYYLWDNESEITKEDPANQSRYLTFFGCLAPTLWLDSLFLIGRAFKNRIDKKINETCIQKAYADPLSLSYQLHSQEINRFQDLASYFRGMDDDEIRTVYARLSFSETYKQRLAAEEEKLAAEYAKMSYWQQVEAFFSDQDTPTITTLKSNIEKIKIDEAVRLLNIFQEIHKTSTTSFSHATRHIEDWRTDAATLIGWGLPLLASVGRSVVFWYALDEILEALGVPYSPLRSLFSITLGEFIAAGFQGMIEVDTVEQAASDLLFATTDGDSSHHPVWKTLRKIGKGYTYIQGTWNTLPYMLLGAKATRFWPTWTRVITLLPFGGADMANNAICFQEAYGDVIYAAESIGAHYGKATPGYMRNRLIDMAEKFYDVYNLLDPQVITQSADLFAKQGKTIKDQETTN